MGNEQSSYYMVYGVNSLSLSPLPFLWSNQSLFWFALASFEISAICPHFWRFDRRLKASPIHTEWKVKTVVQTSSQIPFVFMRIMRRFGLWRMTDQTLSYVYTCEYFVCKWIHKHDVCEISTCRQCSRSVCKQFVGSHLQSVFSTNTKDVLSSVGTVFSSKKSHMDIIPIP